MSQPSAALQALVVPVITKAIPREVCIPSNISTCRTSCRPIIRKLPSGQQLKCVCASTCCDLPLVLPLTAATGAAAPYKVAAVDVGGAVAPVHPYKWHAHTTAHKQAADATVQIDCTTAIDALPLVAGDIHVRLWIRRTCRRTASAKEMMAPACQRCWWAAAWTLPRAPGMGASVGRHWWYLGQHGMVPEHYAAVCCTMLSVGSLPAGCSQAC